MKDSGAGGRRLLQYNWFDSIVIKFGDHHIVITGDTKIRGCSRPLCF